VVETTALSDQRLRFRAANGFASFAPARRGPVHGGSSPIASAAVGFAAPLLGLQCSRTWPSRSLRSGARHTSWHASRAPP